MDNLVTFLQLAAKNRLVVGAISWSLLVVLAWQVGQGASLFLTKPVLPELPSVSVETPNLKVIQGQRSYLLGRPDATFLNQNATRNAKPVSEISNTRLNLTLMGVIDVKGAGVAIIQSPNETLVAGVGEQIVKGVELVEIYADQVVITHRGKQERLVMESVSTGLIKAASEDGLAFSSATLSAKNAQALKEVGDTLRKSPISISKYIRFQPIGQSGRWSAVKIWPKTDTDLFNSIGLKSGDLIKSVNGKTIQDMSSQPSLWQNFLNASQFELAIERQGQLVTLLLDLS